MPGRWLIGWFLLKAMDIEAGGGLCLLLSLEDTLPNKDAWLRSSVVSLSTRCRLRSHVPTALASSSSNNRILWAGAHL